MNRQKTILALFFTTAAFIMKKMISKHTITLALFVTIAMVIYAIDDLSSLVIYDTCYFH